MANDKYIESITSQHKKQPKFIAWLTQNLDKVEDLYQTLKNSTNSFDIDTAAGTQLDIIGKLVGRSRNLTFQPTDGSEPVLDDDMYREYLKGRILQNQWDGTVEDLKSIFKTIFPDFELYLQDNQDMSMKATIIGATNPLRINLIENGYFIPKPFGVSITYEFATNTDLPLIIGIPIHEGTFETYRQTV